MGLAPMALAFMWWRGHPGFELPLLLVFGAIALIGKVGSWCVDLFSEESRVRSRIKYFWLRLRVLWNDLMEFLLG